MLATSILLTLFYLLKEDLNCHRSVISRGPVAQITETRLLGAGWLWSRGISIHGRYVFSASSFSYMAHLLLGPISRKRFQCHHLRNVANQCAAPYYLLVYIRAQPL